MNEFSFDLLMHLISKLIDNLSDSIDDFESLWYVLISAPSYYWKYEKEKVYLDVEIRGHLNELVLMRNAEFWNFVFIKEVDENVEDFENLEDVYFNLLLKLANLMKKYKLDKKFVNKELVQSIGINYLKSVRN